MLVRHAMKDTQTDSREKSGRASLVLLLAVLFAALSALCWQAYQPHSAMWANDYQLGAMTASSARLPGVFKGVWLDQWWIGMGSPADSPSVTILFLWVVSPAMFLKLFTPFTMLVLGFCAWVLFRQLKFAPMVCVLGALAAGLNMHCFSNACWGTGNWNVAIAMIFLAVAALVTGSIRQIWIKAILAGLAVGMAVMEGFDSGAILSVYAGVFTAFLCWITESTVPKKLIKSVWVGMLVVLFAGLIAASTLYTLVGTQVLGVNGGGQSAESKKAYWNFATQWSLPKAETLKVIIPGIFGYRMDEFSTPPDPFFASLGGNMGGWPERFMQGLEDKSSAYWGKVGEDPLIARLESSDPQVRVAAISSLTDRAEYIEVMRGENLDNRTRMVDSVKSQTQRRHSGNGEYAGVVTALFAIFALLNSFRGKSSPYSLLERRMVWFWGIATLFSLMAAWGRFSFVYGMLYQLPGVSSIRNPIKFMHAFVVAWVVLAGFGLEAFHRCYLRRAAKPAAQRELRPAEAKSAAARQLAQPSRRRKLTPFDMGFLIGLIAVAIGIFVGFGTYAGSQGDLAEYVTHQFNQPFSNEQAARIASFSIDEARWFVLLFTLAAGVVISVVALVWEQRWTWAPWTLLCGIMVFDLSRADFPWVRYFNYDQKYSMNDVTKVLMEKPYEHRVNARLNPRGGYDLPGDANFGAIVHWWIENDFPYHDVQSLEIDQMPRTPVMDGNYLSAFPYRSGDLYFNIGGSSTFSMEEIRDLSRVVERLRRQADPVSAFLWQRLSPGEQSVLMNYQPSAPSSIMQARAIVVQTLNKIIGEPSCIYEAERFKGVPLRPKTAAVMKDNPAGPLVAYLNRYLLEDAYPVELSREVGQAPRLWKLTNTRYLLAAASLLPALNDLGDPEPDSFRTVERFNLVPKPGFTMPQPGSTLIPTPGLTNVADAGDLTPQANANGNCALIEYTGVLPRAKLYSFWQTPPNDQVALQALTNPQWDPAQSVLVSSNTPVPEPSAPLGADPGAVSITSYTPKDIRLQASTKTAAVLLYNDRTADDWHVWVDGKRSPLLRCNYIMRGVYLPMGEHTVEFRFQPTVAPLYVTLSAFAVGLALAAYLIWSRLTASSQ